MPGARVAANPRLLSCKRHTHSNVGGKEDLGGPCRSGSWVAPFESSTDDQVVLYCIIKSEEYAMYSASVTSEDQ